MESTFEKTINGRNYKFLDVKWQGGTEAIYTVQFVNEEITGKQTFEMKMDEEGQWKILAQLLPEYVHEAEFELGDAIEDHES